MNRAGKAGRMLLAFTAAVVAIGCSTSMVAQESASPPAPAPLAMVSARVWLNKALDAKKAKADDPVTLKLLDDTKISGGHDLPKNTVLLGHVDRVQASQNKGDSEMQVTFDKAQLKDGQVVPVKVTIMRILPQSTYANPGGGSLTPDQLSPSSTGAGAARNPGAAGPPAGSSAARGSQPGQADESGIGVELNSDVKESSSGTFDSKGRNVYVPGGTEMQIAIVIIPPTP